MFEHVINIFNLRIRGRNSNSSQPKNIQRSRKTSLKRPSLNTSFSSSSSGESDSIGSASSVQRFYFDNAEKFNDLLNQYNEKHIGKKGPFQFVSYANVSIKMCCVCGDGGKRKGTLDKYYVYPQEREHSRTILCRGCVGFTLQQFEENRITM